MIIYHSFEAADFECEISMVFMLNLLFYVSLMAVLWFLFKYFSYGWHVNDRMKIFQGNAIIILDRLN